MIPSNSFEATVPKQKFLSKRSKAKFQKYNLLSKSSKAKVPKQRLQSKASNWSKVAKQRKQTEILVRVTLG